MVRRVLLVLVCGLAGLLVLGGAGAWASVGSFGGEGDESGQFNQPRGISVEQESGDVYVADTENERIDKVGPGGEFLLAWGWGVADGHTEAPQTCTTDCFAGVFGSGGGELWRPGGVTVDNDPLSASHGNVYVMDAANNRVEKFDAAGSFLLAFGREVNATTNGDVCLTGEACRAGTAGSEPGQFQMGETGGIVVDASGDVFVGDVNRVQEFTPGGVYVGQVSIPGAGPVRALAVDASGDVYVQASELAGVHEYEASGVEVGAPRDTTGSFGYFARDFLALGSAGELFVAESSNGEEVGHIREYDSSGGEVASFDRGTEGGHNGVAFSEAVGALEVLGRRDVRVVSPPLPGPLVVSEIAGEQQPTTAAVSGLVNPEGHETSYSVEYGTTASYGASTTPSTLAGSEFEDEPISVPLGGLQPRTTYHFRVVATNSAGTSVGADATFTTLPPVLIDGESVSNVTGTAAALAGQINPLGRDTTYHLEYGPTTAYGTSVPVPDGDAGAGTTDVTVSAIVEGLSAGAVYHYRVVAHNALGTVEGPDRTFTTQTVQAPGLPDGRAWEMVSPPDKHGATIEAIGGLAGAEVQAAGDGSAITYATQGAIGAGTVGNRSVTHSQVLSKRTAEGWSSVDITTPNEAVTGTEGSFSSEYQLFSQDLSLGLVQPPGDTPLAPQATEKTPYLRDASGAYRPLVTAANVPPGTKFGQLEENGGEVVGDVEFSGSSPDLRHIVLSSAPPLTEGVEGNTYQNLYEWFDGSLRLVSVLPNGKAASEEDSNVALGHREADGGNARHAVSDDGARVFWVAGEALYVRDVSRGETVEMDAAEPGAHDASGGGVFQMASSDGSKVFFTDDRRLTPDSTARPGERDLYMCNIVEVGGRLACRLKDLTVDHNPGESASVDGMVLAAGDDGRYVYFPAGGVLAPGASSGACESIFVTLACNFYVYDTVADTVRFIARLGEAEKEEWQADGQRVLGAVTAGASPDGRYFAFMSARNLTGYDSIDAHSGHPDEEVYLYDASIGHLACVSCNPSGGRPSGMFDSGAEGLGPLVDHNASWNGHWLAGSLPGWTNVNPHMAYVRARYLSDSGRLFFDSADALVPRDANGQEDVYEYEPDGVGSCQSASGCVGLISSGVSGEESAFLEASESGNDVFFLTAARLVPQDRDGAIDVYDARVCSGVSPCLSGSEEATTPCVTADACRAAVSPQPGVFGAPSSATFSGAGNPAQGAGKPVAVKKKVLTVARKRALALRKCRAKKSRRKRALCEAQVRRRYRVGVKAKRSVRSPIGKGNG